MSNPQAEESINEICQLIGEEKNKDLYDSLKELLKWYLDDYRETVGGGNWPDRQMYTIGCAFYKFCDVYNQSEYDVIKETNIFTLDYRDIQDFVVDDMKAYSKNYSHKAKYSERKRIEKINFKLKNFCDNSRNDKLAYVLKEIIVPDGIDNYTLVFEVRPQNFEQNILFKKIRDAIRKFNESNENFSELNSKYIPQVALVSEEESSSASFVSDIQVKKFSEGEVVTRHDPLGIEEIIKEKNHKRLIIIGEPGIGKSTTLKHIAYEYSVKGNIETPIYVDLRVHTPKTALLECINKYAHPDILSLGADKIYEIVQISKNFLFLLDGYNEISQTRDKREGIEDDIKKLVSSENNQENRFIITSRKERYPTNIKGHHCELNKLKDKQREKFISKSGIENPDNLLDEISKKNLHSISKVPLFLDHICYFYKRANESLDKLPGTKGELMRDIIQRHFREHEDKFETILPLRIEEADLLGRIIPSVAYHTLKKEDEIHFSKDTFFKICRSNEFNEYLTSLLGSGYKAEDIFKTITQHGLIERNKNQCVFWHQLFQDYFTAVELKRRLENGELSIEKEKGKVNFIFDILEYTKFDQAILLMIGLIEDELAKKVINEIAKYDLLFAGECIAEYRGDRDEFKDIIEQLFNIMGSVSADKLVKIGSDFVINKLSNYVNKEGNLGAIQILGSINNGRVADIFFKMVRSNNLEISKALASSLNAIERQLALSILSMLAEHKNTDVKKEVSIKARYLGNNAMEILRKLSNDTDIEVRMNAIDSLGKIDNEDTCEILIQLLSDSKSTIREKALDALGNFDDKQIQGDIYKLLNKENNIFMEKVLKTVNRINNLKAFDTIHTMSKSKNFNVRANAAIFFKILELDSKVIKSLKGLSNDDAPNVRCAVANTLGSLNSNETLKIFIDMLNNDEALREKYAISYLMGLDKVCNILIDDLNLILTLLDFDCSQLKSIVPILLGYYEEKRREQKRDKKFDDIDVKILLILQDLIQDDHSNVRINVARILHLVHSESAKMIMMVLSKDQNENVRETAFENFINIDAYFVMSVIEELKKEQITEKIAKRYWDLLPDLKPEHRKNILDNFFHHNNKKLELEINQIRNGRQLVKKDNRNNLNFKRLLASISMRLIENLCSINIVYVDSENKLDYVKDTFKKWKIIKAAELEYLKDTVDHEFKNLCLFHNFLFSNYLHILLIENRHRKLEVGFKFWEYLPTHPSIYSNYKSDSLIANTAFHYYEKKLTYLE
ncbi:MAG: HEAT repeat domain-containing protein [Deltaproteobacteria bacterium]|nr:HEAT repeat domain-containing protein [Deltaproteobacteria bacterium]